MGRRVRVLHEGEPAWGRLEGEEVVLEGGGRVSGAEAEYLAPVEPTKILAVHLTYRSRVEEYAASTPPQPSYFLKPTDDPERAPRRDQAPAGDGVPQLRGRAGGHCRAPDEGGGVKKTPFLTSAATRVPTTWGCTTSGMRTGVLCCASRGRTGSCRSGPRWSRLRSSIQRTSGLGPTSTGRWCRRGDPDDLIFPVAYQLADLCRLITLEPGDVVLTGTPANSRPMEPGDVVEVEIDGIGRLTNTVEEWDVDLTGPGEQPETSANTLHVALAVPEGRRPRSRWSRRGWRVKPVLVRQHEEMTPPGLLVEWLEDRGIPYEVHHSYKGESIPDPSDYSFVASLGSPYGPTTRTSLG